MNQPVAKTKFKLCLMHDLRAVNEVEDWPAEGPNPHVLISTVFPADNCFTVIYAFSVPLVEESR